MKKYLIGGLLSSMLLCANPAFATDDDQCDLTHKVLSDETLMVVMQCESEVDVTKAVFLAQRYLEVTGTLAGEAVVSIVGPSDGAEKSVGWGVVFAAAP